MSRTVDFDSVRMLALNHFGDKASGFMEDVYLLMSQDSTQLTLGELTNQMESLDSELIVKVDFNGQFPDALDSYRGYYDQLAICCGRPKSVAAFLDILRRADGQEFTGYKGGEFTMHSSTPMWVSEYGECSDRAVMGVTVLDGFAVITTALDEA